MIDCCEECGAEATRTVHGILLCCACQFGGDDEAEPPQWAKEVPSGLLDDDDEDFDGE